MIRNIAVAGFVFFSLLVAVKAGGPLIQWEKPSNLVMYDLVLSGYEVKSVVWNSGSGSKVFYLQKQTSVFLCAEDIQGIPLLGCQELIYPKPWRLN